MRPAPDPRALILPVPLRLTGGGAWLPIDAPLALEVEGVEEADAAAWRAWLSRVTGVEVAASAAAHPGLATSSAAQLRVGGASFAPAPIGGADPSQAPADESYRLTCERGEGGEARVLIESPSGVGAMRGLATLAQLLSVSGGLAVPECAVEDGPARAWRGLSLDVVRHFYTLAEVGAVVDLLASLKMSVLHLHLTDVQGWRVESLVRPRLTDPAAGGSADFYTQTDLRAFIADAARLGVTVIPEVDLPGHTGCAFDVYPELYAGSERPAPQLRRLEPDHEPAMAFARAIIEEFAALAPSPYLHIGGDEPFGMAEDAYLRFVREAIPMVRATGKRIVAWQEVARSRALGEDDIAQYWIGPETLAQMAMLREMEGLDEFTAAMAKTFEPAARDLACAVESGAAVLYSTNPPLYLDRPHGDPAATEEQEAARARVGMRFYPSGTLADTFDFRVGETPELQAVGARIAGVEAAVWGESLTSVDDLAFLLLPRLAGVAERAWSDAATDWDDCGPRADLQRPTWTRLGFGGAFQPA